MRFQKFRLEQAHRVAARETESFLDDDFVMATPADRRDGGERFVQRIHRHADFVVRCKASLELDANSNESVVKQFAALHALE